MIEVFFVFLRLGAISFGGPIAHLSYFHHEFVIRKKWMSEDAYADLVALCQFLPGPASSQVGMAIGLARSGIQGAIAAWLGFTLPSALILILLGLGISYSGSLIHSGWLHGLKVAAVSVVAQAIWTMGKKLCPDIPRMCIALIAAAVTAAFPSAWIQVTAILIGGIVGWFFLRKSQNLPHIHIQSHIAPATGAVFLMLFVILLIILPILANLSDQNALKVFDVFYRTGSFVFGGGHVVLPLLQAEVVPRGWVSNDLFVAGYGMAQAIPGPLFTFSGYLGAVSQVNPTGWMGGTIAIVAVFLPSFLLILGVLPFWERLRKFSKIRYAMQGTNSAVVGLLISAFYQPVWTNAIFTWRDISVAITGFFLLAFWRLPSWAVVFMSALAGRFLISQ